MQKNIDFSFQRISYNKFLLPARLWITVYPYQFCSKISYTAGSHSFNALGTPPRHDTSQNYSLDIPMVTCTREWPFEYVYSIMLEASQLSSGLNLMATGTILLPRCERKEIAVNVYS